MKSFYISLIWLLLLLNSTYADYLLMFSSDSCLPCQQNKPIVHKLIKQGIDIRIIEYEHRRDLFVWFNINKIPSFVRIKTWPKEVKRHEGFATEQQLKRLME